MMMPAGNKLEKTTEETAPATKKTQTTYLGGYVYENNTLKFFGHEEGRVRKKINAQAKKVSYVYDYFIKDHLGNTRVVLTEEQQTDAYPVASLEEKEIDKEKTYYTLPDDAATRVHKNSVPGYPTDNFTQPNDYVHKLNGNGTKIGSSVVLKVMAGDKFNIRANSWYRTNGANPELPANPLNELVAALAGGVAKTMSGKYAATELINGNILSPGVGEMLNNQTGSTTKPKAGLHWVLFDEQFGYVGNSSGFEQAGDNEEYKTHVKTDMPVNKNGYLYIYVSNETPNIDVFFDNLQVSHVRGALLEETHYYPFGLTMAGISSKAFDAPKNPYQYQGDYSEYDDETQWNEFELRNYDPQIGRFIQQDPYDQFASGYVGMGNDPVNNVDPSGGFSFGPMATPFLNHAFWTVGGAIVGGVIDAANGGNGVNGALIGGGIGLGASFVNWGAVGIAIGGAGKWIGNGVGNLFQSGAGKELLFKTVVGAAKYWGKIYNDNSIVEGREYGSTIYEETKKGKTSYKYSVPNKASSSGASVKVSKAPDGKKAVANIHSHGNSWGENPGVVEADNNFSNKDKWGNYNQNIDGYLTTPDGSLKKYNFRTTKTRVISTDMPSDPKYPKLRKNKIDPFTLPKNEPSVLMR